MAFVAVVWFRDADDARQFHADHTHDNLPGRMVGLFRYPNSTELTCRGFCTNGNRMSPWSRSKRGYMVCGVCGGRHTATRKRVIGSLFDLLGANLMRNPPAAFRTPEGYR